MPEPGRPVPPPGSIYIAHSMVQVLFRAPAGALASLLPAPLEPTEDSDLGLAAVLDTVFGRPGVDRPDPELAQFMEAYVALPCRLNDTRGRYFPYLWLDRWMGDGAPGAGGYFSKLADISLTRINPAHGRLNYVGPGIRMSGTLAREGRRLMEEELTLTEKGTPHDLPLYDYAFTNFGLRYFPDAAGGARPLVHQLLLGRTPDRHVVELWHGTPSLRFYPADNEELSALGPLEILAGHYVTFGYTNIGSLVVHDYLHPRKAS
jgi:acetoacetate decarboxylase